MHLATFQTKIISAYSVEQNATFKTAGLQWLFSNKRTPQPFLESTADCLSVYYNGWLQKVL